MLLQPAEQVVVRLSQIWAVRCVIDALDLCNASFTCALVWGLALFLTAFLYPIVDDQLRTLTRDVQLSCKRLMKCCNSPRLADQHSCAVIRSCREGASAAGGASATHQVWHGHGASPASEARFVQRRTELTSIPTVPTVSCF